MSETAGWVLVCAWSVITALALMAAFRVCGVGLWFHNLPFYLRPRFRRWILYSFFRLSLCPRCGQVVDHLHHPERRCGGQLNERLLTVEAGWEHLANRYNSLQGWQDAHNERLKRLEKAHNDGVGMETWKQDHLDLHSRDFKLIADRFRKDKADTANAFLEVGERIDGVSNQLQNWLTDFTDLAESFEKNIELLTDKGVLQTDLITRLRTDVKRLEEFAKLDLSDIRNLKEKVNQIIPEVLA